MIPLKTLHISAIADILVEQPARTLAPADRGHAAVAMVLRNGASASPEVLFIVRAEHDNDPWSGNIGFPGGRLNQNGETPRQAAERETWEELTLDLGGHRYLGRLDDLYGATMPVLVSCFVYQLLEPAALRPNHEIARTFWCPLTTLLESERQHYKHFIYRGTLQCHPVVELLEPQAPFLWGITYRLLHNFFSRCGAEFGAPEAALHS